MLQFNETGIQYSRIDDVSIPYKKTGIQVYPDRTACEELIGHCPSMTTTYALQKHFVSITVLADTGTLVRSFIHFISTAGGRNALHSFGLIRHMTIANDLHQCDDFALTKVDVVK